MRTATTLFFVLSIFLACDVDRGCCEDSRPVPSNASNRSEPESLGSAPAPTRPKLAAGLADWDQLQFDDEQFKLVEVRLRGFKEYSPPDGIDWSTASPSILRVLREGLHYSHVRRAAVSDLSQVRSQVGRRAHLGVIHFIHEKGSLSVGVSEVGFFLGTEHGASHQKLESWILAKQLDAILKEITGHRLQPKAFAALSGEGFIAKSQAAYEHMQASPVDSSDNGAAARREDQSR